MTTLTYCRGLLTPKEELNPLCLTPFIMFLYDYSAIFRQAEIPLLQGLPRGKHQAQLVEVGLQLCYLAMAFKCPIVKEDLDFEGKKERLRESGQKYARMLSGWAYNRFDELLSCILANRGIELIRVNPAYTSVIGMVKYARQYGLSSTE